VARARGGADDSSTKPVDDVQLMARVKSLVRLKALTDELRARAATSREIGHEEAARVLTSISTEAGRFPASSIPDLRAAERVRLLPRPMHRWTSSPSPPRAALANCRGRLTSWCW